MPIAMPSPNGTNKAKLFLNDNFHSNPAAAYDSRRGLDSARASDQERVQLAAAFLRKRLGADGMEEFKKVLSEDDDQSSDPMDVLIKLQGLLSSQDFEGAKSLLESYLNTPTRDDDVIESPPSKKQADAEIDQPPEFSGRPQRNNEYASDSRRVRSPLFAEDTAQSDAVRRLRGYMDRVKVV